MSSRTDPDEPPLLRVQDLTVEYRGDDGSVASALDGASFDLEESEVLGVLGESGCGKSTLALALLGLLPPSGRRTAGSVAFRGRELMGLDERELGRVRGEEISIVFQEPGLALHPTIRAGDQVADVLRVHRGWSRQRCREEVEALFELVAFDDPGRISRAYPHQLSGGQQQRVAIAQALACRPALVIADEPTAALDATIQAEIIALLRELKDRLALALVFISHDAALLGSFADHLVVMYAGHIVETGPRDRIYRAPLHPYTRELLRCAPRPRAAATGEGRTRLPVIPGAPPDSTRLPAGCRFEPRCPDRLEICARHGPNTEEVGGSRRVRCFNHGG